MQIALLALYSVPLRVSLLCQTLSHRALMKHNSEVLVLSTF